MSRKPYQQIDDAVALRIAAIHDRYPKLGHQGILSALADEDIRIDPRELERFMAERHVKPQAEFKPLKFRGAPTWLGGNPRGDK
jgi:hypothetical protein